MTTAERAGRSGAPTEVADRLLLSVLTQLPFDGPGHGALRQAARAEGVPVDQVGAVFPDGIVDVLWHLEDWLARSVAARLPGESLASLRVRDRIAEQVMARLELLAPHRDAVRALAVWLASPARAGLSVRLTWRACDAIWHAAGDRATDINHYTKRGLLAPVMLATQLVWLGGADDAAVRAFLDRRLAGVLTVGRGFGQARERVNALAERADPFRWIGKLRRRA